MNVCGKSRPHRDWTLGPYSSKRVAIPTELSRPTLRNWFSKQKLIHRGILGWGLRKLCDRYSQNSFGNFKQTTRCGRVPLQKLLLHKKFSAFLKADGSIPCSPQPASWHFPGRDGSSPHHPIYSEILRNIAYHIDFLRWGIVTLLLKIVEGPTTVDCTTCLFSVFAATLHLSPSLLLSLEHRSCAQDRHHLLTDTKVTPAPALLTVASVAHSLTRIFHFYGDGSKLRKATVTFVMYVCQQWNNSAPAGRIFMKF